LQAVGITHVVTVDVHTQQLEGFFRIPVDSLTAVPILVDALRDRLSERNCRGFARCRARADGD
jgi:ribose-phosphate pyrophosphokinase